jgi:hypothetical protein
VYDYAGPSFAFAGYVYTDTYSTFRVEMEPCTGTSEIRYFWNGVPSYSTTVFGGQTTFSRGIFAWNNISGATDSMDVDNYLVTREACPASVCGDGTISGPEECEAADDSCCPGRCVDCLCTRPHEACGDPRPLGNGVNGPFLTDGGMYSYTADTPFTSVETCGSDYDTVIHWDLFNNCTESVLLNDECNELDALLGQDAGDPSASCFVNTGGPPFQAEDFPLASCLCSPTTPGNTYEFLVDAYGGDGRPALCGNTLITITKKATACGEPIQGGACCDRITGLCSQVASAQDCAGQFQIYSDNKTCDLVECEGIQGACCNSAPGAGGACMQTLSAACQGNNLTWTPGADCASVNCTEDDGACCNRLTGTCSLTLQAACVCPDCVWTEDAACGQVSCTPIQGACCVRSEQTADCSQTSQAGCEAIGGEWTRETDCANVTCDPLFVPIPTVSEWGLVIMALLLLVGGKVYFGRRQTATA